MVSRLDSKGAEVCKSCRSRQELPNGYLVSVYTKSCKIWRRYSRERASQNVQKVNQNLEEIRKNIGKNRRDCRTQAPQAESLPGAEAIDEPDLHLH